MSKSIPLTKGKRAKVDDNDFERISRFKWRCSINGYAVRHSSRKDGPRKTIRMHRFIMNAADGTIVDHVDGDRLNNQRENLRICTWQENCHNVLNCRSNKTSRYKGVCWHKRDERWRAQIKIDGKVLHLGRFDTEVEAACAYDSAARTYHGEFAVLNELHSSRSLPSEEGVTA